MTIDTERMKPLLPCPPCETSRTPKIAIVGGGFSGTLVLAHLIATGGHFEVELFEARDACGPGIAYGTCEAPHLLNVQAARMGAFEADDFHRWLQSEPAASEPRADAYVPRALYGRYLKDVMAEALDEARRRGIRVRIVHAAVTDIAPRKDGMMMLVAGGRRWEADSVVLATGNFPPRPPIALSRAAQRSRRYVGDLWSADAKLSDRLNMLSKGDTVLVLGTGLTAVDAILTLRAGGFDGKIVAISRRGHLPLAHKAGVRIPWTLTVRPEDVQPTARALLAWLRREAKLAEAEGVGWRSIFDAVRPFTHSLWRALDARERVKVLRRFSLWNIHRHRMAPAAHAVIEALRETGQLEVLAARCSSIERRLGGFTIRFRRKGSEEREALRPALIVNCIGPEYDVAHIDHPLFRNLLRRRLIMRSPAGGVAARDGGVADGRNEGRIFAIGPLLLGELLETTAVPELRELAKDVAASVHARLSASAMAFHQ
jgi:uncharacterized NAD(P)/FAD-binding protein YdhS